MLLARQRQDLIKDQLKIPVRNASTGHEWFTELSDWTRVLRQDDDGNVFTLAGIFYSIDLDFKDGQQTGYFAIATLVQHDGEHEHNYEYLATGETEQAVRKKIEKEQLYDVFGEPHKNSMLSYFDGTTAVSKYWLREIPEDHFNFLKNNRYMQGL